MFLCFVYCFYFCFVGVLALAIGLLLPWWYIIIAFCIFALPAVLVLVCDKCVNYLCYKDYGINEDNISHHSMNALNIPRPVLRRQECQPDMRFSISLTPMDPGRRGVINCGTSTSVYTNPSANQHTQLPIVNDLKKSVLPTYENAKRYKTLSNPDGDP